jgi:hypothetical protein
MISCSNFPRQFGKPPISNEMTLLISDLDLELIDPFEASG